VSKELKLSKVRERTCRENECPKSQAKRSYIPTELTSIADPKMVSNNVYGGFTVIQNTLS